MSCVNQVYETDNAAFQAYVTLPSGGEILGGYDASLNQLIFAYENICDPAKVTDLTSGWSSSYASNVNKTALDDNCAGTSTSSPVLLYDTPSSYDLFNITQMANFNDPSSGESIIVCGGDCNLLGSNNQGRYGFIFSFYLATGNPYTKLDSVSSVVTGKNGWFIKQGNSNVNINQTQINCIYTQNDTIIYGGWRNDDSAGPVRARPLLEKIVISGGSATTTTLISNEFTGYNADDTDVTVADITSSVSGVTNNCLVIYQTELDASGSVHIRELDFTGNVWKTNDFPLTTQFSNLEYDSWDSKISYASSCLDGSGNAIYIATNSITTASQIIKGGPSNRSTPYTRQAQGKYPIIYPIVYKSTSEFILGASFQTFSTTYPSGPMLYIDEFADYGDVQIDNMSFITKTNSQLYSNVTNGSNNLFVSLSTIANTPKLTYITFLAAPTSLDIIPGSDYASFQGPNGIIWYNQPSKYILNSILDQNKTNDSIVMTKGDYNNYIKVELDSKLTGKLNDLQFKLAFCSSKLHLFAFGNYVNSPSNASVSSFALLNAISWICLSKGTQILCDQGIINIEKINTRKHTINNKQINHITQSIHTDDYLIKIKKNCLSSNSPSSDIICSGDHKILYKNNLIESKNLINEVYGIEKIKNDKRVLYNILMDKHEVIMANNTPVESLHPQNIIAMFYNNYNTPQAREFLSDKIGQMNKNNHYITEANKTNSIHLRNGTSKKTSIPLRIGNKK